MLPFENLSEDKENAFFADGVQDDILTKLAKIADLKFISRNSVMEYRGKRNAREIGKALRVSHVLEGIVRKTGARLHLNAQLTDRRTDAHVWAKQYDLDLNQPLTIQSEIAKKIAKELNAKISAAEALAIAQPITTDLIMKGLSASARANFLQAVDLLDEAVVRGPAFSQAYSNSPRLMATFTSLGTTIAPRALRSQNRRFNQRFAVVPMPQAAFIAGLAEQEKILQIQPDYGPPLRFNGEHRLSA